METNNFEEEFNKADMIEVRPSRSFNFASNIRKSAGERDIKRRKEANIIIPYDDNKGKYIINEDDITKEELKEYLISTLARFNSLQVFHYNQFHMPMYVKVLYILFCIVLLTFYIYTLFLVILLCVFNPMIMIISFIFTVQIIKVLLMLNYTLKVKFTKSHMNEILKNESCQSLKLHEIMWKLGRDGLWLEISKQ